MKTSACGYTFFEIILVLTFAALLSSLGIIGLGRLQSIFRLSSTAGEVGSLIQYGRSLAVANKNNSIYSITLSENLFRLNEDGIEINRVSISPKITVDPVSFSLFFDPYTGVISSCACTITFSEGSTSEVINIMSNGIVN